ncbi:MAG: hypothetical protein KC464_02525, partial [Myxococcales bacterium]|nr:hypothetical protein [Myxococcales bacterium]
MLGRKFARSLANTLLALAMAGTALGGCAAKKDASSASTDDMAEDIDVRSGTTGGDTASQEEAPVDRLADPAAEPTRSITTADTSTDAPKKEAEHRVAGKRVAASPAVVGGTAAGSGAATGQGYGGGKYKSMNVPAGRADVDRNTEGYKDYGVNAWTDTAKDH